MMAQQAAMVEGVSAEERQLQLDFHTLLADYVVGRRQVERHPDAEQRFMVEEKFLKRAEDRLRDSAKRLRELPGERKREEAAARRWEVEADTWMLLGLRREDLDYPSEASFRGSPVPLRPGPLKEIGPEELEALVEKSALKVMEEWLNHQQEFRRLVLLVTWLELLRERDLWLLRDEVDGLEGYEMWPSTCQREGVPALDPDYAYQGRLAPVDERQDLLLLERIWRFLRAGRLEEAVDLCQRCGQAWRAASISGGDPWDVFPRPEEEEEEKVQGPNARRTTPYKWVNNLRPLLWRRMCAALAEKLARVNDGSSQVARMERTVYAALALDPALLLHVGEPALVTGWEDRAWAAFRAKMEWELHLTMREVRRAKRRHSDLYPDVVAAGLGEEEGPAGGGRMSRQQLVVGEALRERSVAQIFAGIEEAARAAPAGASGRVGRPGGGERLDLLAERRLQAGLMQGELMEALQAGLPSPEALAMAGGEGGEEEAARLRLWAHAALFVLETGGRRALAQQGPEVRTRVSAVLQRYMRKCLWSGSEGQGQQSYSSSEHVPLLALYASFLPRAKERRRVFAEYMEGVHASSLRGQCREQALLFMGLHDLGVVVAELQERLIRRSTTRSDADLLRLVQHLRAQVNTEAEMEDLLGLPAPMLAYQDRGRLGDADAFRVKALEWLDDPRLNRQAILHATALLRATVTATASANDGSGGGQGVIFSDALLAIISYGEGILGITAASAASSSSSSGSDPEQQQQLQQRQLRRRASLEGGSGVGGQQSIGEGTVAYKSHVEEWAGWKAMAEAQVAFLRWVQEARGCEARRQEVEALVLQQERQGQDGGTTAANPSSSLGAAVDFGMQSIAQAVGRLAGSAEAMAAAAREASVALMRILRNADVWLASGLTEADWAFLQQAEAEDDDEEEQEEEQEDSMMEVDGRRGKPKLNPVERHVFATKVLRAREEELGVLRATCLPEMVALLHQVLHDTARLLEGAFVERGPASAAVAAEVRTGIGGGGQTAALRFGLLAAKCYMWALQLASVVADPRTALHEYFPRGRFAAPPQRASLLADPFTLDDFLGRCQESARGLLRLRADTEWAGLAQEAALEAPWRMLEAEEEEGEE